MSQEEQIGILEELEEIMILINSKVILPPREYQWEAYYSGGTYERDIDEECRIKDIQGREWFQIPCSTLGEAFILSSFDGEIGLALNADPGNFGGRLFSIDSSDQFFVVDNFFDSLGLERDVRKEIKTKDNNIIFPTGNFGMSFVISKPATVTMIYFLPIYEVE